MNTEPSPAPAPPSPQPAPAAASVAAAPTPASAAAPAPVPPPTAPPVAAAPVAKDAPPTPSAPKVHELPQATDGLLGDSIADAYTLLNFACRRGIKLDTAAAKNIIDSHDKNAANHRLTSQEQCTFWEAFSTVIDRVKPVTVESIVYTKVKESPSWGKKFWGQLSLGEQALRRHLVLAIVTLSLLLVVQVEWAIGTAIYNDAYKVHGQYLEAQATVADTKKMATAVASTEAGAQATTEMEAAQRQLEQDASWRDVSFVRLWWWNRQIAALLPPYDLSVEKDGPASSAGGVTLDEDGKRRIEFTRAELTLTVMSNYILVTLFALLGAVTQSLRNLTTKMADVALTSNEVIRGITRIILGVISGVCMAWLYVITMDNTGAKSDIRAPLDVINFLGAFAPWALAFISGYSVEIFFTALERFIAIVIAKIKGMTPLPSDADGADIQSSGETPTPAPTPAQASIK